MLDWLRGAFLYIVAFLLPIAGAVLAVWRVAEGDRKDGVRILAAAVLGACVYGLLFFR